METADAWNDTPSSQRKDSRYHARWKVMLVFDSSMKIPHFQTLIHDLSMSGMSVQYHSEVKAHTAVTLLLSLPPKEDAPRKTMKLKAEVSSSIPFRGGFRLGMRFIRDTELANFQQCLEMYVVSDVSLSSDPETETFPQLNF
jgi:hypothetical protein